MEIYQGSAGKLKDFSDKYLKQLLLSDTWYTNIFHYAEVLAVPIITRIQATNPLIFGHKAWTSFLEFNLLF
jgi:hypothetical protein